MRIPARSVHGHLIWSHDGPVWAVWRLTRPIAYPHLGRSRKIEFLDSLRRALGSLDGEAMLLSVCEPTDPADQVDRMVDGVDLDAHPAWREEAEWTYEALLGGSTDVARHYFIAVALPEGSRAKFGSSIAAASNALARLVGGRSTPPSPAEIQRAQLVADRIEHGLRNPLAARGLRPATTAELRWLHQRLPFRGVMTPPSPSAAQTEDARVFEHLVDAVYHEGGRRDDENRRTRRYVRVETETGVSYQTFLTVSAMPAEWEFPDGAGEWFLVADSAPFPIDWCVRITAVANDSANRKSRRQARELHAQVDEYDGEPAGAPPALFEAMANVDAQRVELAASPNTPELETSLIFSVAADNLVDLEDLADSLRAMFHAWEYHLPRPIGQQMQLMRAMLPGAAAPSAVRDYRQHLMPLSVASGVPFAEARVGEDAGMLLGFNADAGLELDEDDEVIGGRPVFCDLSLGPRSRDNFSACLFGCGGLGGGKSYTAKRMLASVLAAGGQVAVLDRTEEGEYVRASKAWAGRKQIVTVQEGSPFCIDPLQVFAGAACVRYAAGFLTMITGVGPTEDEGVMLQEAVRAVAARPNGRLLDVSEELRVAHKGDARAQMLARKITSFSRNPLAQPVFGGGEPLQLSADGVVFWTPNMPLPKAEELSQPHLARKITAEKLIGQGVLYLVAAMMHEIVRSNPNRFAVENFDEVWWLDTPQGKELLNEGIRDFRKVFGGVWIWSQHPGDLAKELLDLIPTRLVFRQSQEAASAAVALVREPTQQWTDAVQGFVTGECLLRDMRGRPGHVRAMRARPRHDEAFKAKPGEAAAAA
jgi:hypothetical protein